MEIEQPSVPEPQQPPSRDTDDTSAETSVNTTPVVSGTPTGTVMIPSRDRSGTIIARPVWDQASTAGPSTVHRRSHRSNIARLAVPPSSGGASTANSTDTSRPETETEDDGDVDMDQDDSIRESDAPSVSGASTPERRNPSPDPAATVRGVGRRRSRRAVGIVSDTGTPDAPGGSRDMNADAHIIINDQAVAVDGVGGIEDGIVPLDTNDDFAMGAPPGAPGAIDGPPAVNVADGHAPTGERTPRAGPINLPGTMPMPPIPNTTGTRPAVDGTPGVPPTRVTARNVNAAAPQAGGTGPTGIPVPPRHHHHHHHHHDSDSGPYRDEDVLLALQLLAYLSKYSHVRQAFYKSRVTFHPASAQQSPSEVRYVPGGRAAAGSSTSNAAGPSGTQASTNTKEPNALLRAFATATGRGKEKAPATAPEMSSSSSSSTVTGTSTTPQRMTNVFSLVERFTFRPSSSEVDSPNPPPTLPQEIQHWAGVIMRNACRKDDSRGGIRQCANSKSRTLIYTSNTRRSRRFVHYQCCAGNGRVSHASSPNGVGAGKPRVDGSA